MKPTLHHRAPGDRRAREFDPEYITNARVTETVNALLSAHPRSNVAHAAVVLIEDLRTELNACHRRKEQHERVVAGLSALHRIMSRWGLVQWAIWRALAPVAADRLRAEGTAMTSPFLNR